MDCPKCGCPASRVVWSRIRHYTLRGEPVARRIRRRECEHCGQRFTTREEHAGG